MKLIVLSDGCEVSTSCSDLFMSPAISITRPNALLFSPTFLNEIYGAVSDAKSSGKRIFKMGGHRGHVRHHHGYKYVSQIISQPGT